MAANNDPAVPEVVPVSPDEVLVVVDVPERSGDIGDRPVDTDQLSDILATDVVVDPDKPSRS